MSDFAEWDRTGRKSSMEDLDEVDIDAIRDMGLDH
jgi:hypothetical protein